MPLRGDFQKLISLREASPRPNVVRAHATAIPRLRRNNIRHGIDNIGVDFLGLWSALAPQSYPILDRSQCGNIGFRICSKSSNARETCASNVSHLSIRMANLSLWLPEQSTLSFSFPRFSLCLPSILFIAAECRYAAGLCR